jgi:uncharacterized protein (TIGR03067 family)
VLAGLAVAQPAQKEERKSAKPPDGEWVEVRVELDGVAVPRPDFPTFWRFTPESFRLYSSDNRPVTVQAAYFERGGMLEADFGVKKGPSLRKAIWKLDGKTLTICEGPEGGDRPTDFSAPKGSSRRLTTLKRISD